jgi:hypothetical protein
VPKAACGRSGATLLGRGNILEVSAAEDIRRRGWRQCSIAGDALRERLMRDDALRHSGPDDLLIIATQDCDLVCPSFEAEPHVEILVGRRAPSRDGNCLYGKNPRRLQFDLAGTSDTYEVQAISRFSVPREILSEYDPDAVRCLDDVTSRTVPEWLGKRYARTALPDAFNDRIYLVQTKIRSALKKNGELVEAIFLELDPKGEANEDEPYSLLVKIAARDSRLIDDDANSRLAQLAGVMTGAFRKCAGVVLVEPCTVVSAEVLTLGEMSRSVEWDAYDDLSFRE